MFKRIKAIIANLRGFKAIESELPATKTSKVVAQLQSNLTALQPVKSMPVSEVSNKPESYSEHDLYRSTGPRISGSDQRKLKDFPVHDKTPQVVRHADRVGVDKARRDVFDAGFGKGPLVGRTGNPFKDDPFFNPWAPGGSFDKSPSRGSFGRSSRLPSRRR